jgi:hypothetical protein
VLELPGGKYAERSPTRERMVELGKQVLEYATAHEVDVMEAIDVVLSQSPEAGDRKLLEMIRKTMADSELR